MFNSVCWIKVRSGISRQRLRFFSVQQQLEHLLEINWWRWQILCGRLVDGVGPKMKSCYLLRVKQRLAFCCPLLPNKLFFVFWEVRLLPGVFSFQTYRCFLWFVPFWVRGWVRSPTSTVPKQFTPIPFLMNDFDDIHSCVVAVEKR